MSSSLFDLFFPSCFILFYFILLRCFYFEGQGEIQTAECLGGLTGGDSVVSAAVTLPSSSRLTPCSVSPTPHSI